MAKNLLPRGVAKQLEAAKARTGPTDALRLASRRLPVMLAMSPKQFERYARKLTQSKKRP